MVASRNQRSAGWRTERGGVEHVVAQAIVRNPLKVRRLDGSAECAARSKSNVVRQDQKNIWSPFRRFHALRKIRRGVLYRAPDLALELRLRLWQNALLGKGTGNLSTKKNERKYRNERRRAFGGCDGFGAPTTEASIPLVRTYKHRRVG